LILDVSLVGTYDAIRGSATGKDTYRVVNEFLNIRQTPSISAASVARLVEGDSVEVIAFTDAAWAHVRLPGGQEGYAAQRYLAKMTSEEKLAEEKKKYEGQYFVHYGFVNVRKQPDQQSEKMGEIAGQAIVRPISVDSGWAKVPFEGKEGYISTSYISPFMPNLLVRQNQFQLPVLHYHIADGKVSDTLAAIALHVARLRQEGMSPITFATLRDLLIRQQKQDVRLDPKTFVVAVSGLTPDNAKSVSDTLYADAIPASLFLETRHIGLTGITEKMLLTFMANGFDIQSATHTGDDLRALTNAQVELELRQSRQILESFTKKPVFAVAYPQGGVNDRVMQIASEAGYLVGLSDGGSRTFTRDQLLRIPGMDMFPSMTADEVLKMAKGE